MFRFFQPSSPFYNVEGGGGSGSLEGGSGSPSGGSPSPTGSGFGGGSSSGAPAGSNVYELTPDSLIKPPGAKEPVKYSDYQRQYIPQSEWTKKTQQLAQERQAWEQEKQRATQLLLQHAQQLAAARGGNEQGGGQPDLLQQLREAPYVDGNTAAQLYETLQTQGIQPVVQAIQQRDKALQLMFAHIKRQDQVLQQLQGTHQQSRFNERVTSVRTELGLPDDPEANEFLADLYAAYEGPDLDEQYPELARKRVEGLRRIFRELDRRQAQQARQNLIPGRGGNATPGRQLNQGYKSPEQIANELGAALGLAD